MEINSNNLKKDLDEIIADKNKLEDKLREANLKIENFDNKEKVQIQRKLSLSLYLI